MISSRLASGCGRANHIRRLIPLACVLLLSVAGGCGSGGGSSDNSGKGGTMGASGGHSGQAGSTGGANAGGGAGASGAAPGGTIGSTGGTGPGGLVGVGGGVGGTGPGPGGSAGLAGSIGTSGGAGVGSGGVAGIAGAGGASAAAGSGGGATTGAGGSSPGGPGYPYIFAVFNDSAPKSDLIIYTSNDALNFTLLYDTGYVGPTGFLRDPSIMKHTDGKFYVAFTTPPTMACCGPDASFSIASSSNLKDWTTVTTVPSGVAGVTNTWAPEWFKDTDGSVYALVNVDGKTYRYKALNASLTMFSGPTWIGIGPGYIDTFVIVVGTTYHAFTKHESTTYVEHATATSIDGPWTFVGKDDWAGWGDHKEAPAVIDLGNGTYRFYCDAGSQGHEMYSDSSDMFQTWTAPKTLPTVGNNISHGTVIHGQ
jgi:hypothetical protein